MSTSDWSEEELSRLIEYDAALAEGSGEEVRDQLSLPGDEALEAGASIITMLHRYYETEVRKQADPATGDAGDAAQMSRKIGRFEIAGELGRGGCGLVYRAYDPAMARDVALKVIIDDLPLDGIRRSRFFREARVAGRLNHPHLVTLFDIGQSEGELFLAMELCAGLDLDRVLGKERTPMPWRDAVALVWAIAQGLGHAHSHGITHRDVKPGNILLQPEKPTTAEQPQSEVGDSAIFSTTKSASRSNKSQTQKGQPVLISGSWYVPKLGDFGLACLTSASGDHTAMGTIIGTPNYMAPEQAQGQRDRVGPPTDVYALGCVLYELLTGRPPIVGNDPADTLRRIVADRPVSLHRRDRNVPRDINVICMKCLQHDPQARYANANELADDLRRVLEGDPIHRRPLAAKSVAVAVGLGACWLLIILGWSKLSSFWQPPASVRPAAVATTPPKLSSSVLETPASFKPIHHYRFIPQKSNPQAILDSVGTAHGLICSPTRTCKLEAAGQLRISQLSDYVEIPAEYLQDLENVTVEIWFTPTSQAYSCSRPEMPQ